TQLQDFAFARGAVELHLFPALAYAGVLTWRGIACRIGALRRRVTLSLGGDFPVVERLLAMDVVFLCPHVATRHVDDTVSRRAREKRDELLRRLHPCQIGPLEQDRSPKSLGQI